MKPALNLTIFAMAVCNIVAFGISMGFTGLTNLVGIPWAGYSWDDMHGFVVPYVLDVTIVTVLLLMAIACKSKRLSLSCYAATLNLALPIFC
jgi:ABC-type transport system involved in cytochrome c biogenesis permease subunit